MSDELSDAEIAAGPWPPRSDVWWISRADGQRVCPEYRYEYGGMGDEPRWDCDGYDHTDPTDYVAERMVLTSRLSGTWVFEHRARTIGPLS